MTRKEVKKGLRVRVTGGCFEGKTGIISGLCNSAFYDYCRVDIDDPSRAIKYKKGNFIAIKNIVPYE